MEEIVIFSIGYLHDISNQEKWKEKGRKFIAKVQTEKNDQKYTIGAINHENSTSFKVRTGTKIDLIATTTYYYCTRYSEFRLIGIGFCSQKCLAKIPFIRNYLFTIV